MPMLDDLLTRRAMFTPATYDANAGTVEAVASTFAPVRRAGFVERLDPAAINVADLVGLPVLDGHKQGSARDVIGSVTTARMDGRALIVTIRRTSAPDADPIWQRVADQTIRGVSIGYAVRRWRETAEDGGRRPAGQDRDRMGNPGNLCRGNPGRPRCNLQKRGLQHAQRPSDRNRRPRPADRALPGRSPRPWR